MPETVAFHCQLCDGHRRRTLFVARDRLLGQPGEFPVVQCLSCGLAQLHPMPTLDELISYYPDTYYPVDTEPSAEAHDVAQGLLERVQRWAQKHHLNDPRVLDVGCGTGLFLHLAQQRGMHVHGIELSESAVTYGRERYGLDIHRGTLETAHLPAGSFDVITMWHVLEHLHHPVDALRRAAAALAPGGLLLIAVPNFASFEARLFGRRWYSLDTPRHLYHFSSASLTAAVERAGLRAERIIHSAGTAGLVYSIMGDLTGVSLRLRSRRLNEAEYARAAKVLRVACAPLCWMAAAAWHGGALEVYAVKPTSTTPTGAQPPLI